MQQIEKINLKCFRDDTVTFSYLGLVYSTEALPMSDASIAILAVPPTVDTAYADRMRFLAGTDTLFPWFLHWISPPA